MGLGFGFLFSIRGQRRYILGEVPHALTFVLAVRPGAAKQLNCCLAVIGTIAWFWGLGLQLRSRVLHIMKHFHFGKLSPFRGIPVPWPPFSPRLIVSLDHYKDMQEECAKVCRGSSGSASFSGFTYGRWRKFGSLDFHWLCYGR